MCFSPYLGVGGGGGSQVGCGTTCFCSFLASAAQKWSSLSPLRGALPKAIEFLLQLLLPMIHALNYERVVGIVFMYCVPGYPWTAILSPSSYLFSRCLAFEP